MLVGVRIFGALNPLIRKRVLLAGSVSAGFSGKCFVVRGAFSKRGKGLTREQ